MSIDIEKKQESEDLQLYIQKWIAVDNQLQLLNEKTKKIRDWKKKLTEKISQMLEEKGWQNRILEIPDGELKLQEKNEYSTLSFGYIEECLQELMKDEDQIDFVMNYLRDHREVKTSIDIRRKKNIVSK